MQDTQYDRIISNRIIVDKGAGMNNSRVIPVPTSYINNPAISNGASLFLLRLHAEGGQLDETLNEMSVRFNMHRSSIDRYIDELEEAGIIRHTLTHNKNTKHWQSKIEIVGGAEA
jgi:hypothetical protein